MHQNVSIAEAVVLSCFQQPGERNRIVYERENFPSVRYVYQARSELEVVATDDVVGAIDERTLLVPIQHVLFKSGEIQDVESIVERAHEAGAYVVLDAYQSAGTVPLDVTALGVDFAVGGSVKWLCGGPGAGWLYVRPDLIERLEPSVTGWQAHARPFAFEPELEYAEGIARFLTGTPNVPALYACTPGYDLIEEIGVERIRANSLRQTQLPDRRRGGARLRGALAARAGAARRHGDRARARLRGGAQGAVGAADPLRLPPGRGHPPRPALLHERRGARVRARPDRGDPRDGRARALARRDGSLLAMSQGQSLGHCP